MARTKQTARGFRRNRGQQRTTRIEEPQLVYPPEVKNSIHAYGFTSYPRPTEIYPTIVEASEQQERATPTSRSFDDLPKEHPIRAMKQYILDGRSYFKFDKYLPVRTRSGCLIAEPADREPGSRWLFISSNEANTRLTAFEHSNPKTSAVGLKLREGPFGVLLEDVPDDSELRWRLRPRLDDEEVFGLIFYKSTPPSPTRKRSRSFDDDHSTPSKKSRGSH